VKYPFQALLGGLGQWIWTANRGMS
jgi:hypothetical protein